MSDNLTSTELVTLVGLGDRDVSEHYGSRLIDYVKNIDSENPKSAGELSLLLLEISRYIQELEDTKKGDIKEAKAEYDNKRKSLQFLIEPLDTADEICRQKIVEARTSYRQRLFADLSTDMTVERTRMLEAVRADLEKVLGEENPTAQDAQKIDDLVEQLSVLSEMKATSTVVEDALSREISKHLDIAQGVFFRPYNKIEVVDVNKLKKTYTELKPKLDAIEQLAKDLGYDETKLTKALGAGSFKLIKSETVVVSLGKSGGKK